MKRLPLILAGFFAIAALPLVAANITGKVAFVTKRGQNPLASRDARDVSARHAQ